MAVSCLPGASPDGSLVDGSLHVGNYFDRSTILYQSNNGSVSPMYASLSVVENVSTYMFPRDSQATPHNHPAVGSVHGHRRLFVATLKTTHWNRLSICVDQSDTQ